MGFDLVSCLDVVQTVPRSFRVWILFGIRIIVDKGAFVILTANSIENQGDNQRENEMATGDI